MKVCPFQLQLNFKIISLDLLLIFVIISLINLSMTELHVASGMANVDKWDPGSSLSENYSIGTESDMSVSSAHMEGSQSKIDLVSTQNSDMEVRYPFETTSLSEDCSTSRIRQSEDNKAVQRNRSPGTGERGKRKRWRGRNENLEIASEGLTGSAKHELGATDILGCTNVVRELLNLGAKSNNLRHWTSQQRCYCAGF